MKEFIVALISASIAMTIMSCQSDSDLPPQPDLVADAPFVSFEEGGEPFKTFRYEEGGHNYVFTVTHLSSECCNN